MNEAELIARLGIDGIAEQAQQGILQEAQRRIGAAISETLTAQQAEEYQAILESNESVIQAWLDENMPEYKNTVVYEEVKADETASSAPEMVVASIYWIQKNVPNFKELVDQTLDAFAAEIASHRK